MLSPRRPELRGTCERAAQELAHEDSSLRVVRGWYIDAQWGRQEHWWCERPNGTILDPTVEQFPTGHVPALREYQEYQGVHSCPGCGAPVVTEDSSSGFCCGPCLGGTVGVPMSGGGTCRC